ncbi:MAG: hypothetical protein VXX99_04205 [Bacteroidota bacterium]|nr:hypothetical protein [Bacteroidota bacterium]
MNKNSIKAIFIVLIFLTSKIGVALNVHYCGGHIQEIALAWNVEGCGISLEKSHDTHQGLKVTKNHCCQDKTVFIQNNEPQKTIDSDLQVTYFEDKQYNTCTFDLSKIILSKAVFVKPKHLIFREKIFLLYHSFIFYG